MGGPKMGLRPADFNEEDVRKSPTFQKWTDIPEGGKLRYACRDFIKGNANDEERLMRRIMIARRNNIRDHEQVKRARKKQEQKVKTGITDSTDDAFRGDDEKQVVAENPDAVTESTSPQSQQPTRKRRYPTVFLDADIAREMDVEAVVATRSYKRWLRLPDGTEFEYNQKLIKGTEGDDWILRKNIWRRMRYRREQKKMVEEVLQDEVKPAAKPRPAKKRAKRVAGTRTKEQTADVHYDANAMDTSIGMGRGVTTASQIVDQALLSTPAGMIAGIAPLPTTHDHHHHHLPHHLQVHHNPHERSLESTAAEAAASIPHDPDTDAVVEAAVAAGESYANATNPFVHNPLNAPMDGLGLALDAAARLAAAKAASLDTDEAVLAAAVAGHAQLAPHHLLQHPQAPSMENGPQEEDDEELGGELMDYIGNV